MANVAQHLGSVRRLGRALKIAVGTFLRTECNQRAAAISYRVLFSLVPFVSLVASLVELLLPDEASDRVTSWLLAAMPLEGYRGQRCTGGRGRRAVSLAGRSHLAAPARVWGERDDGRDSLGLLGDLGERARRPYVRGKLVDIAPSYSLPACCSSAPLG